MPGDTDDQDKSVPPADPVPPPAPPSELDNTEHTGASGDHSAAGHSAAAGAASGAATGAAAGAATGAAAGAAAGAHGAGTTHTTNPLNPTHQQPPIIFAMASPYMVFPGGGYAQTTTTYYQAAPPPPPPPPPMPIVTNTVTTYLTGGFAPQAPAPGPVTYYPVQAQQVQPAPQVVSGYAYLPGGQVIPTNSVVGAAPAPGMQGQPPMVVCVAP